MRSSLVLMVVLGAACSSKAELATKVDGKKTFDKLGAEDRKQLCADFIAFGKKNRNPKAEQEATCKLTAVIEAGSTEDAAAKKAACKASYDACMAKPMKNEPPDEPDCTVIDEMTCDITVNDFVACMQEQVTAGMSAVAEVSCDKLPEGDATKFAMDVLEKMSGGPKCKTVKDRCDKP